MSKFDRLLNKINGFLAQNDFVEAQYYVNDLIDCIETKKQFILFMNLILDNFSNFSLDWENTNLFNFLEAFTALTDSVGNEVSQRATTWGIMAHLLWFTGTYE